MSNSCLGKNNDGEVSGMAVTNVYTHHMHRHGTECTTR